MSTNLDKRLARLEAALEPENGRPIVVTAYDEAEEAEEVAKLSAAGIDENRRLIVVIRTGVPRAERA